MNSNYQQEIDDFKRNFAQWQNNRIALYGIGRYTATLIGGLSGFDIVGLMDKDPMNIGKKYFGLPVLSPEEVKHSADIIVINTAGIYWELIYKRVKDLGVPVFFRNGEIAKIHSKIITDDDYWKSSYDDLQIQSACADIVSFDFYDTLFSRKVYDSKDVIKLLEAKLGINLAEFRSRAINSLSTNYSFDELYTEIAKISGLNGDVLNDAKCLEIEIEKRVLTPREPILHLLRRLIAKRKEVYVITDMYLPNTFFANVLQEYGAELDSKHLLVSSVVQKNKANGELWKLYKVLIGEKQALHIGDNEIADVEMAKKYGIDSFYLANAKRILELSSLSAIAGNICSGYASMAAGLVISKLFDNPFALNTTHGKIVLTNNFIVGYTVFAPVILTFFEWLRGQVKQHRNSRLVFMARDGYFLKEDFDEYLRLRDEKIDTAYLGISRQLAMTAAAETDEEILQLANMPYTGTLDEMMEDRFEIYDADIDCKDDIAKYLPTMRDYVKKTKTTYKKYIDHFHFYDTDAVIDLGYYGNNQRYLNQIAKTGMSGYYFNANTSDGNKNMELQDMIPCFQTKEDNTGKNSGILKYQIYLESFLTAPYGMVKNIADDGSFICKEKRKNQKFFSDKREINEGVKSFIRDYISTFGDIAVPIDCQFIDTYYRLCFEGGVEFDNDAKRSFYNDNAMMHRREVNLFE